MLHVPCGWMGPLLFFGRHVLHQVACPYWKVSKFDIRPVACLFFLHAYFGQACEVLLAASSSVVMCSTVCQCTCVKV
jgi:hypothetical protein